jgi:hypothetical protein
LDQPGYRSMIVANLVGLALLGLIAFGVLGVH